MPRAATGSATSIVTTDLMKRVGVWFPEAHLNASKMTALAQTAVTVLGFDNIMPLFSVWHESAALGCEVDWGDRSRMPTGKAWCSSIDANLAIPCDRLLRRSCTVPFEMGGTSNFTIVRNGTAASIGKEVQEKLAVGIDIIGPECAVPLDAPCINLRTIADEAKRQGAAKLDHGT